MGMSASQARYLALTERMNDIEYQGQQINQQRTTLSNQVNALYNSLLEMNVPTPPSTKDYQKTIYKGSLGATKYTVDSTDIIPKADNKYSITLGMQGHGDTVSKSTGFAVVTEGATGEIKGAIIDGLEIGITKLSASDGYTTTPSSDGKSVTSHGAKISDYKAAYEAGGTIIAQKNDGFFYSIPAKDAIDYTPAIPEAAGQYKEYKLSGDTTNASEAAKESDGLTLAKSHVENAKDEDGNDITIQHYYTTGTWKYTDITSEDTVVPEGAELVKAYQPKVDAKYELKSGYSGLYQQGNDTKLYYRESGDESQKGVLTSELSQLYVIQPDGSVKMANSSDFAGTSADNKYYLLQSDKQYFSSKAGDDVKHLAGAINTTVNGKSVYSFEDLAQAGVEEDTIAMYKQAIAQSGLSNDEGKALDWTQFYVVINGDGKNASFVLKDDLDDGNSNCEVFDYSPNSEIEIRSTMDDCLLSFDASNGRITSISYPNRAADGTLTYTTIKMEATVETDDVAYKEAYSKYEYDKTIYDKEQNEINKKTS